MKRRRFPFLSLWLPVLTAAFTTGGLAAQDDDGSADVSVAGSWTGTLAVPGGELRVVFNLEASETGLSGTMESPDQTTALIPLARVELDGRSLVITVPAVGGRYTGDVSEDGRTISGTWSQGMNALPLNLVPVEAGTGTR